MENQLKNIECKEEKIMVKSRAYTIDRSKKFVIIDKGKIISKHVDFYNAQKAVERHLRNRKLSNNYEIVSISKLKIKK